MIGLVIAVSLGLMAAMAGAWLVQKVTGNSGWVDAIWTFATGAAGGVYALLPLHGEAPGAREWLVGGLVVGWALRLGSHIAVRTAKSDKEDPRYARFREDWGAGFQGRLFGFLMIQALSAALLAVSVLAAARRPGELGVMDLVGGMILLVAIVGEGQADAQLARFRADPANKGKVCDTGLWAFSRHPNYFFEWLGWLAYPLIAIDLSGAWPLGFAALTGPAFMFVLLRYVSGVPPLEDAMVRSRGAAFAAYQARVSAFFPLPPKPAEPKGATS